MVATAASRVQHLPFKVPVTITGGRTVEGSDKPETFSESTMTVLVLAQGTVIRVFTALVPGQRVTLFNEKTKKEVVCQVVKSKPAGPNSRFVQLQFMEPIAGFWGLLIPGVLPASIPTSPVASAGHATPAETLSAPAKPAAATPPLPATGPEPATRYSRAVSTSAPQSPVAPPPVDTVPRTQPARPALSVNGTWQTNGTPVPPTAPPTAKSSPAQTGTAQAPAIPPLAVPKPVISSGLLDFSKEIEAILAGHNSPGSPRISSSTSTPHPSPATSTPTVEGLKLLAARLQADLSSLPIPSTPAASPAPPAPPIARLAEPPAADTAKPVLAIPRPAVENQPVAALSRQEEAPPCPQADVFEEQSLGKSTVLPGPLSWLIANKHLSLGLAAVALLVLGIGGTRYFRQSRSGTATAVTTSTPLSNPSPVVFSQPANNLARDPSDSASADAAKPNVSSPVAEHSSPVGRAATPTIVHFPMAAPVVNRAAGVHEAADDLPALTTNSLSSGSDPLALGGSFGSKGPVAPPPVGGEVKSAQRIKYVPPVYPELAKAQRVFGNVQIDAFIDASGNVATLKVLSGPMILRQAALDSVKQWKYLPALLDGQPTSMHITVTVQFTQ